MRLRLIRVVALLALQVAVLAALGAAPSVSAAGVTVSVSSPANNATVSSPVTINASASSTSTITGWHIYVDSQNVYGAGQVNAISASISMSIGSHQVVVRAWDSTGAYGDQTLTLNVQAGTTIGGIDQMTDWVNCTASACGTTNGGASFVWQTGASAPDGSAPTTKFGLTGGPSYSGMYMYHRNLSLAPGTGTTAVKTLTYAFDLYMPSASINAPQAIEFEVQQENGVNLFNFAWQLDYGDMWQTQQMWLRLYNYSSKQWVDSGLPKLSRLGAGWHHISAAFHTSGTSIYHDSITIDGTTYMVPSPNNLTPATSSTQQVFNNAVQLDINCSSAPYTIYLRNMSVTYSL